MLNLGKLQSWKIKTMQCIPHCWGGTTSFAGHWWTKQKKMVRGNKGMHCSIQEGCSTVHTSWNASPEESEIPSISSPLLFLVFNLLCQEKDKSFIMLEVWPQTKLPKRCFRAFSTWACAISAGTWQAFPVTFAIIHKLHIPSVLLHKGSSFYSWLAPLHSLPLKPEAAKLTLYKEFKVNSKDCSGEEILGAHWFCYFIVIVSVYSCKWCFFLGVLYNLPEEGSIHKKF